MRANILDLEMVVENLADRWEKLRLECVEHGAKFTPKQEGKWEGAFVALRGVLVDELRPMLENWQKGEAWSRKGEELLAEEAAAKALEAGRLRGVAALIQSIAYNDAGCQECGAETYYAKGVGHLRDCEVLAAKTYLETLAGEEK